MRFRHWSVKNLCCATTHDNVITEMVQFETGKELKMKMHWSTVPKQNIDINIISELLVLTKVIDFGLSSSLGCNVVFESFHFRFDRSTLTVGQLLREKQGGRGKFSSYCWTVSEREAGRKRWIELLLLKIYWERSKEAEVNRALTLGQLFREKQGGRGK